VKVDRERLTAALAEGLRLEAPQLTPIGVSCAWPVFKVTAAGGEPFFLKVTVRAAAERTLAFLKAAGGVPFLPQPVVPEPIAFGEYVLLCLEWKEVVRVNAEEMSEAQLASFARGCRSLADVLASYAGPVTPLAEDDPTRQYEVLREYAVRHPFVRGLLRPLLSLPAAERTYGERPLTVIHGDLQPRNYGFDGERLAAVFDTDDLTRGLACEDAAYAFTERARRSELAPASRLRLADLFRRLVGLSPWPVSEWRIAVNHARLRIATRRIAAHPRSPFIAFDVARRDRPLRVLAGVLEEGAC